MLVSRLPRAKLHNLSSITSSNRCISRYFLTHTLNFHSFRDVYSSNVRIGNLSRAGKMDLARKLFDEMPTRDVVSWNAVITGYWKNGFIGESKRMFDLMPLRNVVSWNSMIAGCVENGMIDIAFAYFSEMPERNTASWNAMISGFIRYKRVDEAVKLFEQMPKRNVISYTAMIDGYAQKGEIKKARELFDSMTTRNEVSWSVMISAYVENEQFDEAREIFGRMPCKNVVAITAMITGYCKEGKMEDARVLFEEIECKDDVSFNAMITGYAHNGRGEEALKLLTRMIQTPLKPDQYTLVSILSACSSLASLTEGKQTHALVFKLKLSTHVSVGNTLITMYSKCGCLPDSESAFEHIKTPNIVSWNTIIAAFAQHGAYEKALGLFKKIELHGIEPDGITFLSLLSACGHAGKVKESLYWFKSMKSFYKVAPRSEHYACLIDILGRSGEVKKAYEIIQEMPFEPDSGVWGAILARCSFSMNNNTELAELAFEKLTGFDPKNSGAYVMLSNIYASLGLWRQVTRVRSLMKENEVKKQTGCKVSTHIIQVLKLPGGTLPAITATVVILATLLPRQIGYLAPAGDVVAAISIQVFFAVLGVSGSIWNVIMVAPSVFVFAFIQVTVHLIVILGLGKLLRLDLKLLLLASNANIGGPTTASGMATAKGWGSLVIPGILVGIFGISTATYLSYFFGTFVLKSMSGFL